MVKKRLKLNKDTYQELTFDEVLEMYHALILNHIKKFQTLFPFLLMENEDLYQLFSMSLYKAYKNYDVSKDVGFGLVAKRYLTHKSMNISKICSAEKRRNRYCQESNIELFLSLEDPNKTDDCLAEIVASNYINNLKKIDKEVMKCKQEGLYVYEIMKKLNISRQYIGLITFRHKKNIKKELMLGGVEI
jgi:DNA-directed RNA polymerase specialized sigma subunit